MGWMSSVLWCAGSNYGVLVGLGNLRNLELAGNTLHEATVSSSAFSALENLLSLQVDQNHFTSIPLGLPRSLQVCWGHDIWLNGLLISEGIFFCLDRVHLSIHKANREL